MHHFLSLPVELQLSIIQVSDIRTCINLMQTCHQLRKLTLLSLAKRLSSSGFLGDNAIPGVEDKAEHRLSKYLLSFYSPCNKISASEKFYYQVSSSVNHKKSESSVKGLSDIFLKFDKLILTKNLFNEVETNLTKPAAAQAQNNNNGDADQISTYDRLTNLKTQIPLLVNEDSSFFKVTFSLLVQAGDTESPRTKLIEINEKIRKSALSKPEGDNRTAMKIQRNGCWEISYNLSKQGIEPPQYDYDYEVFENFTFGIESVKFSSCYLLSQLESENQLSQSLIF